MALANPTAEPLIDEHFELLGLRISITANAAVTRIFGRIFEAFAEPTARRGADIAYLVADDRPHRVLRNGTTFSESVTFSDLLYDIEKDVILELQYRNPSLLFIHAGVVAWQGRASLLVAESGGGKSTSTWGLINDGYAYLSDELAPIDVDGGRVYPYPHALCLKCTPPGPYPLPLETMHLERTRHVPTSVLPAPTIHEPCPIDAVFLLQFDPATPSPSLRRLSSAEAAARVYINALNALAHYNNGLDAVLDIATRARCYALRTAGLPETCDLISSVIEQRV
jgi:hypothetical protein